MISLSRVPRLHRTNTRTEPLQSSLSFLLSSDERYGSTSCRGCLRGLVYFENLSWKLRSQPQITLLSVCRESRDLALESHTLWSSTSPAYINLDRDIFILADTAPHLERQTTGDDIRVARAKVRHLAVPEWTLKPVRGNPRTVRNLQRMADCSVCRVPNLETITVVIRELSNGDSNTKKKGALLKVVDEMSFLREGEDAMRAFEIYEKQQDWKKPKLRLGTIVKQ